MAVVSVCLLVTSGSDADREHTRPQARVLVESRARQTIRISQLYVLRSYPGCAGVPFE